MHTSQTNIHHVLGSKWFVTAALDTVLDTVLGTDVDYVRTP